jgi:hypothetical protein
VHRHSRRQVLALLALAVGLSPTPPLAAATPAGGASCPGLHRSSSWEIVPAPTGINAPADPYYRSGIYLAVDPLDQRRLYASTDRRSLLRSTDGGCTWHQVFDLGSVTTRYPTSLYAPTASQFNIDAVVTPHGATAADGSYVYVLAQMPPSQTGIRTGPVLVAVSRDAGSTWTVQTPAETAAMPFGAAECSRLPGAALVPAPSRPLTAYVYCPDNEYYGMSEGSPHTGDWETIYRTTDGGASWTVRSHDIVRFDTTSGTPFGVSTHDPAVLYGMQPSYIKAVRTTTTQFLASHDAGSSWATSFQGRGWDPINVGFSMVTPSKTTASLASYGQAGLCVSRDAGRHGYCWKPPQLRGMPGLVTAATWAPAGDKLLVAVGYDMDFQYTRCAVQRIGVFTVKDHKWRAPADLPAFAPSASGASISSFVATATGRVTLVVQPCSRTGSSGTWVAAATPINLARYTTDWTR